MYKIVIVIISILCILQSTQATSCVRDYLLTGQLNTPVNWWVSIKLSGFMDLYLYHDSAMTQPVFIKGAFLRHRKSAFGAAMHALGSDDVVNYIAYNDHWIESTQTDFGQVAHEKGIVAWGKDNGFWIQHSLPNFPNINADGNLQYYMASYDNYLPDVDISVYPQTSLDHLRFTLLGWSPYAPNNIFPTNIASSPTCSPNKGRDTKYSFFQPGYFKQTQTPTTPNVADFVGVYRDYSYTQHITCVSLSSRDSVKSLLVSLQQIAQGAAKEFVTKNDNFAIYNVFQDTNPLSEWPEDGLHQTTWKQLIVDFGSGAATTTVYLMTHNREKTMEAQQDTLVSQGGNYINRDPWQKLYQSDCGGVKQCITLPQSGIAPAADKIQVSTWGDPSWLGNLRNLMVPAKFHVAYNAGQRNQDFLWGFGYGPKMDHSKLGYMPQGSSVWADWNVCFSGGNIRTYQKDVESNSVLICFKSDNLAGALEGIRTDQANTYTRSLWNPSTSGYTNQMVIADPQGEYCRYSDTFGQPCDQIFNALNWGGNVVDQTSFNYVINRFRWVRYPNPNDSPIPPYP